MREPGTEEASHHCPACDTRLEADSVLLEYAEWRHQFISWGPKPVKWKISRYRDGPEGKSVGSEVASLQQFSTDQPCSLPLCHPVDERWLAAMGWLSSGGPLVLCW